MREWFDGESLAAELARRRSEGKKGRSVQEAVSLLEPAVEGIAYAHDQGVAHLSLNPSNLFVARRAGGSALKVLDFGVARTMNELASGLPPESAPQGGLRVLFPAYAAPEQLDRTAGETGAWTDVYSIALILMELLSDRIVMQGGETGALVERVLDDAHRPTPNAHGLHLSRNLELVLSRAVARAPEKRQKDAGALWRDVKSALRGTASRAMPTQRSEVPAPPPVPPPLPPRAQTRTLMGITPGVTVAGAVPGRQGPPSAPGIGTLPMSFEPQSLPLASEVSPAAQLPPLREPSPPPPVAPPVQIITAKLPPPLEPQPAAQRARASLPGPRVLALMAAGCIVASLPVLVIVALLHGRAVAKPAPSVSAPVAAPPPPPVDPTPEPPAAPPAASAHFSVAAARRALDAVSGDVMKCRRDKTWGVAQAKVTFANDGSVGQVVVGPPFAGTPTGQCVKDTMSAVQVPPFGGEPAVFVAQFFVAQR